MSQIALVSDQHDDDVGVGMISQLLQPAGDVLISLVLADVVHEQCANGASVVCRCDRSVSLLSGSIPDLRLNSLLVYLNRSGRKLNTDGGLGIKVELIASKSAKKVGLSNTGVSDQDN